MKTWKHNENVFDVLNFHKFVFFSVFQSLKEARQDDCTVMSSVITGFRLHPSTKIIRFSSMNLLVKVEVFNGEKTLVINLHRLQQENQYLTTDCYTRNIFLHLAGFRPNQQKCLHLHICGCVNSRARK